MAKKNRKNKVTSDKSPKKPLNVKLLVAVILASVLSTVIYFGLTELSVILSEKAGRQIYIPVIEIYTILSAVLLGTMTLVNSGMSRGEMPTEADLPDEWSPERKTKFLESVRKKLSNERFVANAPEAVVAVERKKESDSLSKIESINASLKALKNN